MRNLLFNTMAIFNELVILLLAICMVVFTDYVPDVEARYNFGWVFLGIIGIDTAINVVVMLVCAVKDAVI